MRQDGTGYSGQIFELLSASIRDLLCGTEEDGVDPISALWIGNWLLI